MDGTPSREAAQISIAASSMFPGFRFSPTDEELISYYLRNKMCEPHRSVEVIPELEIWRYEPWELPAKSIIPSESEWFFFSPRGRKYPNGSQSRRATESGYWKATGKERNVKSASSYIGTKRTLVFHIGRAPKGERTEWIMHEYCMLDKSQDSMVVCRLRKNVDFCLNDSANRASSSQRPVSTVHNLSNGASEAGGAERAEKAADCSSKKSDSSYDSYSIEQMDSASGTNQKPALEVTQPQCSGHQKVTQPQCSDHRKDYGDEDDFFAEILKDDIIKLDEPSMPGIQNISASTTFDGPETKSRQPVEDGLHDRPPIQGTANRRILLKREIARNEHRTKVIDCSTESTGNGLFIRRNRRGDLKSEAKLLNCCSSSPESDETKITVGRSHVVVAMLILILALFVSLVGGFWRVRRMIFESLYQGYLLPV